MNVRSIFSRIWTFANKNPSTCKRQISSASCEYFYSNRDILNSLLYMHPPGEIYSHVNIRDSFTRSHSLEENCNINWKSLKCLLRWKVYGNLMITLFRFCPGKQSRICYKQKNSFSKKPCHHRLVCLFTSTELLAARFWAYVFMALPLIHDQPNQATIYSKLIDNMYTFCEHDQIRTS